LRIRKVDASEMDQPRRRTATQKLTPAQLQRRRLQRQAERTIVQLTGPDQVFEVRLGRSEKPATVRQRLLRAAADANKEIAVRKSERGFLVGLMTPERRTRRGRRKSTRR
jgi:hypothetical protein